MQQMLRFQQRVPMSSTILGVLFFLTITTIQSYAGDFDWTGGGDNTTWEDAGNWSLSSGVDDGSNGYPDATDNATIDVGSGPTLDGSIGCAAFTVGGTNDPTVTLSKDATFTGTVTINGVSILDVNANQLDAGSNAVTGTGTVSISTGILTAGLISVSTLTASGSASINISGDWSVPALGFTPSTSVVTLSGSATSITTATTFGRLVISKSGSTTTATMGANVNVNDTLRISTGVLATGTFTLAGNGGANDRLTISNAATLRIEGTNGFPTTFDNLSFGSGSNVEYAGTTQTVGNTPTYENLRITASGIKTAGGNLSLNGNLVMSAGTLTLGSNTITATGTNTLTMTSSSVLQIGGTNSFPSSFETTTLSGGTVEYNGTNQSVTVVSPSYNNLTLTGAGSKTAAGALTIAGTVTINAGSIFDAGAFTHLVAGDWNENSTGMMTSSGTINFNGSAQTIYDSAAFNNVTFSGGGAVTLAGTSARGDSIYGNLTISNATTISVTTACSLFVRGNWDATGGTFAATLGLVSFYSGSPQSISASSFFNVAFSNAGTKTATGAWDFNGAVTINSPAIVNGSTFSHTAAGAWTCNGTFSGSSSVTLDGGAQTLSGTTLEFYDLSTATSGGQVTKTLTAGNFVTINNSITIANNTILLIQTSGQLVNGGSASIVMNSGTPTAQITINVSGGFPSGFSTYNFGTGSTIIYNINGDANISGGGSITYQNLTIQGTASIKTALAGLNVDGNLVVAANNTLDLAGFDHTFAGSITLTGTATIANTGGTGTVTLDAPDAAQTLTVNTGTFTVNNLSITLDAPTAARIKTLTSNTNALTVTGNFSATNAGGDAANTLTIGFPATQITSSGGVFSLGANVILDTRGSLSLFNSMATFASASLNVASTVYYFGLAPADQMIAVRDGSSNTITYGNLQLGRSGGTGTTRKILPGSGNILDVNGNFSFVQNVATLVYFDSSASNETRVAGNWTDVGAPTVQSVGLINFDGTSQTISQANFYNVTFSGSGTKTISGAMFVSGDMTIGNGVTVSASTNNISFTGSGSDFINSGTGVFTQTTGTTSFGSPGPLGHSVTTSSASQFGNVTLTSDFTVTFNSDAHIFGTLSFVQDSADLDISSVTIRVDGNWTRRTGTVCTVTGSTVDFGGSNTQTISVFPTGGNVFNNVSFTGAATKQTDDVTVGGTQATALDINGDVSIGPGATFAGGNVNHTVAGSWTNSGSFSSTGTVTFDGAAQSIGTSTFSSLVAGGTGTKTLAGNITLTSAVTINDGVTLDVSTNNYSIVVGTNWTNNVGTNTGVFEARSGKVTFSGTGANTILTGDDGTNTVNKNFYLVDINKTAGTATLSTYRMDVDSNFTIVQGTFATGTNNLTVGHSFINNGTFTHNANSTLTFDGASGTDSIRTNASNILGPVVFNAGATYKLSGTVTSTYAVAGVQAIRITAGTLDLNGKTLTVADSIILTGGTLEVDSAARLQIAQNMAILNAGGTVRIVGTSASAATVTRSGAAGGITITQTSGTFHAKNYVFDYLRTTGITISGGTVDATNNFSNGTFSNHQDGSVGSNYLNLTSISWTSTDTIKGLVLNSGADFNISWGGSNDIVIQDATGNLAGESFDNETGSGFITWVFPNGITWDRGAGTDDWHTGLNWSGNTVPGAGDYVILDHTNYAPTITIDINTANAACGNLVMSTGGGNPISLVINGYELTITGDLNIGSSCTLTQTTATDTIDISGNWSNSGTHNAASSAVVMNGSGTKTITSGTGARGTFYDLILNASGATYQLNDSLRVSNDFTLTAGTLDVTAGNRAVVIGRNWSNSGTFNPRAGTIRFNRAGTGTQTISGGPFWDVVMDNPGGSGTATKQITSNLDIDRSVVLNSGTVMDGGTNTIYLGSAITANTTVFTNNASATAFQQTGAGTLIIDNVANRADFPGGSALTAFNNLTISGAGTKRQVATDSVNGDLTVASGSGAFDLQTFSVLTRSATKTFTVNGNATLTIGGANSFPANFATVSLNSGSTVSYNAATDQNIAAVTYGNLSLSGGTNKVALGHIGVAGTLTVTTAGTNFNMYGFDLSVTGLTGATNDMNFAASTVFTPGSGTVTHNGDAWNIDAQITAFNNLILGGSGAKTLTADLTINGNLTVNSGVTLAMATFQINGTGSKTFTMSGSSTLTSSIAAPDSAFPKSFGTNTLSPTSTVSLNVASNQIIKSAGVTYGNLTLTSGTASDKTANGPLNIAGNLNVANATTTFYGGPYSHTVGGNWTMTGNYFSTGTVTFNGTTQSITYNGADTLYFHNLAFSGSGTKTLGDGNDVVDLNGNMTINNGTTVNTGRNIAVAGDWSNSGSFTATAGTITFDGTTQSINAGTGSSFNNVAFTNGGPKTFVTNGADVNGTFTITGVTVDMGTLTHNLGGTVTNTGGTWTTTNARLIFDGAGQTITSSAMLIAKSITCSGTGTKTMGQDWSIDSLTIANGVTLNSTAVSPNYDITLTGSWLNNGTFTTANDTVFFESNNASAQTIYHPTSGTANSNFNVVMFNTTQTSARRYSLTTPSTTMRGAITIGSGAMLDLNSNILIAGNGSTHTVSGILEVDANANLRFNNTAGNSTLNVNSGGILSLSGSGGSSVATLTRSAGANRTAVTINGILKAQYYLAEYITDAGFNITTSATLDADSNLSNGTWSNLNTATGSSRIYLVLDANATGIDTIRNMTFNFSGTPTAGTHFNVVRTGGGGTVGTFVFAGTIDGNLNGLTSSADVNTYESDPDAEVRWPINNTATWTGNVDRDWNVAGNWNTSLVPDANTDAIIPSVVAGSGNAPKITTADAQCRNLTITDGNLTIENGYDLNAVGDISIGSTGAGVLAVSSASSEITVGGSWTRGASGVYTHGSGRVTFTATTGTKTITPLTSAFSTVVINGSGAFSISGASITVNDTLRITGGAVTMTSAGQTLNLAGHFVLHDGASFNDTSTTGRLFLNGSNQSVTGGVFYRVWAAGSGTKTFNGSVRINDTLRVFSTLLASSGAVLDMNGPVTIHSGGTFDDGGQSHTFAGNLWTQNGTYTGTGTVTLDGAAQTINTATFNNLVVAGTGTKTLAGNITITGNLTVNSTLDMGSGSGFSITGSGTNTLIMGAASTLTTRGPFPASFESFTVDATSTTNYSGTSPQTVGSATYGNLVLNSNAAKTLGGDITVLGNFNMSTGSLDVSASNYTIYVAGNWTNSGGAVFTPGAGEVIFNGSGTQTLNTGGTGTGKKFYKLGVDKTAGSANLAAAVDVDNNLSIYQGTFANAGLDINIGGNLITTGTFTITGGASTVTFDGASASLSITSNNTQFQNIIVNAPGSTISLQDGFTVLNDFTVTSGTFNGNGQLVNFGNGIGDVLLIDGIYNVGPGGTLAIGAAATVTVNSGGNIRVVGTSGNIATVTRNLLGGAGTYGFQVNGTIHALNYAFEYMNASGIQINDIATIDADSNFSSGTFTNGAAGGTLLRIETSQTMTIANISFPLNPGGGAKNVTKTSTSSGVVTFDPYTGSFGGAAFENDAFDLLNWPVPVSLTWDGSVNTDWFNKNNWTVSSGPDTIPYAATDVVIASATNQPVITSPYATCNGLTINNGATVTITTSVAGDTDLIVNGNLTINGTLTVTGTNDVIHAAGDWTKAGAGTFNNGGSTVYLTATSGTKIINNGTAAFYNLSTLGAGVFRLGANTTVANNVTIAAGNLDVSGSNFTLNVGGNWANTGGTFTPRAGTVTFDATGAVTRTINAGTSSFFSLSFNGGASTIFQLATNNLTTTGNTSILAGTLDLNGLSFNHGDGTGDGITVTGTLTVDANASLRMSANATLTVNSGGRLELVGSSDVALATLTRQSSGTYSLVVSSGGTMAAQYYLFEYMDANGIQVTSGALVDGTNDFRNGTFSNGAGGGRYWLMEGEFSDAASHTLPGVTFNSGPSVNVSRTDGALVDTITFEDPSGSLGNYSFEDDILPASASDGLLKWTSTATLYTWVGSNSTDWNDPLNWDVLAVPSNAATHDVIIPNVTNDPVLSSGSDGVCRNLTIQSGGLLTIQNGLHLTINNNFDNSGTLTVAGGSASNITVGNVWTNGGTFNSGSSTVIMTAASGTKTITLGAGSFNHLNLNGGATFQPSGAIDVNGNFTISAGTFDVTASSYQMNVAGDWTNSGTFTSRSGTVIFDGTGAQNINSGGTGVGQQFYNFRILKTSGTATLTANLDVNNDFTLSTGTLSNGTSTMNIGGNWNNTGATFTAGAGLVTFDGTGTKTLTPNNQPFESLTINKTGGGQVTLNASVTVNGNLTVTAGTLFANNRTIAFGDNAADAVSLTGTLNMDAGSILQLFGGTTATVNSGGALRAVGTSTSSLATISRRTSGNYSITVNGTIHARFATIEYTGGNGITVTSTGTIDGTNNFSDVTFQNGAGTAYLTLQNAQTFAPTGTRFDSSAASRTTYNATHTGTGQVTFANYTGTMSGVRYEGPDGSAMFTNPFGRVRWNFDQTQSVPSSTTARFGNDVVITSGAANLGNTTVALVGDTLDYFDESGKNRTSKTVARYYTMLPTNTGTVSTIRLYYGDFEIGNEAEASMNVWQLRAGTFTLITPSVRDVVNNYVEVSSYAFSAGVRDTIILSDATDEVSLPVELAFFDAKSQDGRMILEWRTESELNNLAWVIEKKEISPFELEAVTSGDLSIDEATGEFTLVADLRGQGTKSSATDYKYVDDDVKAGVSYAYRLADISLSGARTYHEPVIQTVELPKHFALRQNFPNPFNPSTTIRYELPVQAKVTIRIYNILGQEVFTLVDKTMEAGFHETLWKGQNTVNHAVASGVYIYRITAQAVNGKERFAQTRKMTIVK